MYFRIKHISGARAGQEQMVPGPMIRLGRDPSCEVAFDPEQDDKVSSAHAQILMTPTGQILLSDLNSSNGTFLGEAQVTSPTPIASGTAITLGDGGPVIEFHLVPVAAPQATPAPPPSAPPQPKGGKNKLIIGCVIIALVLVIALIVGLSGGE